MKLVNHGVLREIEDVKWRDTVLKDLDITGTVEALMKFTEALENIEEDGEIGGSLRAVGGPVPPHEEDEAAEHGDLYDGRYFVDDISGATLDKKLAVRARRTEIKFFKDRGVYTKCRRESWMRTITTKWLDVNKGDEASPNYRARLVGREVAYEKRDDLFAATPPLESLKAVLSICASRQARRHPHRIMSIDVKRAYFYAPATRPLYIEIPAEDKDPEDEGMVAKLNLSLYGTRDAAMNWTATFTNVLTKLGFTKGKCSPCNFEHTVRGMAMTVHGDDFTVSGSEADLAWLKFNMEKEFEITCELLGPKKEHKQEVRILNRVIKWTDHGITYEADQRHAEIVVRDLGLEDAKPAPTPGTREEFNKASLPKGVLGIETEEQSPELDKKEASAYRGVAARLNYLAQDRPDLQYSCKEASRRMAKPRQADWAILKRIGRYLLGAPRLVQSFDWQDGDGEILVHTDSDWAGCRTSYRSTSGGTLCVGKHCLKTWSSTQATIALSSAEAELYALCKGASQALGAMALLEDFGIKASAKLRADSTAAIGIVRRSGLGKVRHLNVRYLWMQEKSKTEFELDKVLGTENPADLLTKNLALPDLLKYVAKLNMEIADGRATTAPKLAAMIHANEEPPEDDWIYENGMVARIHSAPREELFTPMRVAGSPPSRRLTNTRITEGTYIDDGETFRHVDAWTSRNTAHRSLGRRWVGVTKFLLRTTEAV